MARTSETDWSLSRLIAGWFLGLEALWWLICAGAMLAGNPMFSLGSALLGVASFALALLTVLAIVLLVRAPRAGAWLALVLQVIVLGQTALFWLMSTVAVFLAVPLAIVTLVALIVGWPRAVRP